MKGLAVLLPIALAACAVIPRAEEPQQQFLGRLQALCGQSYAGRVTTGDAADREMAANRLVMHVAACTSQSVRIPFHVGDDRSRTWVLTRTDAGLRLKHDHRHADGGEDVLTQYGGDTISPGNARRQEFPADAFSRDLFLRQAIPQSATNVWAVEIEPGRIFAYELRRPGRHFRVEFDLTRPVATPPPAWGTR